MAQKGFNKASGAGIYKASQEGRYYALGTSRRVKSRRVEMESGNKKIRRFEDIVAWQKARELVKIIYKMTNDLEDFRKDFGLY